MEQSRCIFLPRKLKRRWLLTALLKETTYCVKNWHMILAFKNWGKLTIIKLTYLASFFDQLKSWHATTIIPRKVHQYNFFLCSTIHFELSKIACFVIFFSLKHKILEKPTNAKMNVHLYFHLLIFLTDNDDNWVMCDCVTLGSFQIRMKGLTKRYLHQPLGKSQSRLLVQIDKHCLFAKMGQLCIFSIYYLFRSDA